MLWSKCSIQNFKKIANFIIENESIALNISSKLKRDKELVYPSEKKNILFALKDKENGKIEAIALMTYQSEVYVSSIRLFNDEEVENLIFYINLTLPAIKLLIITPSMTQHQQSLIENCFRTRGLQWEKIDYNMMEYCKNHQSIFLPNRKLTDIRLNNENDERQLKELHAHYLVEEVTSKLRPITREEALRISLPLLKNEQILCGYVDGKMVTKANTNLKGITALQLGGIYTLPEMRQKGIATAILQVLIEHLVAGGWDISLYVKNTNQTATNVYLKCGFKIKSTMSLYYLSSI